MALRLFQWIDPLLYFIKLYKKHLSKQQLDPLYSIVRRLFIFQSLIADNTTYLGRIGVLKFTDFQRKWISRSGVTPTIFLYVMDIYDKLIGIYRKAKGDMEKVKKELWESRYFFILKLSEFPMQIHYLNLSFYPVQKKRATALSIISPLLFSMRHF